MAGGHTTPCAHLDNCQMLTKRYARCPQWCQVTTKIPDAQKKKGWVLIKMLVLSKINAGCPARCHEAIKMPGAHQKKHWVHMKMLCGQLNATFPTKETLCAYKDARGPGKHRISTKRRPVACQDASWAPKEMSSSQQDGRCPAKEMPRAQQDDTWPAK